MAADLRKMQENRGFSENRIDKSRFARLMFVFKIYHTSMLVARFVNEHGSVKCSKCHRTPHVGACFGKALYSLHFWE